MPRKRRICFVSGTRAEFGLMDSTLRAIAAQRGLELQIVATGMHLDRRHGDGVKAMRAAGWRVAAVAPWSAADTPTASAIQTGNAIAHLARLFHRLKSDVVLVVGDRVEPFAAAAAAHIAGLPVAHVHGGDRALGQVDDALRHAITKLAHVHFPATLASARRIRHLGEQPWRIHRVGSPGLDGIQSSAASADQQIPGLHRYRYALLVLHPADADERLEERRARSVLIAVASMPFEHIVIVYPNNDPGSGGIIRCWEKDARGGRYLVHRDVPRKLFLGLMRDAAVLVGNSSSGIIEAASFHTPVLDIGPRQLGREHSTNVIHVPYHEAAIRKALQRIWNQGRPCRAKGVNVYGSRGAGNRIAATLAGLRIDPRLLRKLIAY